MVTKMIIDLQEGRDYKVIKRSRKNYHDNFKHCVNKPKPAQAPMRPQYVRPWVWVAAICCVFVYSCDQQSKAAHDQAIVDRNNQIKIVAATSESRLLRCIIERKLEHNKPWKLAIDCADFR